MDRKKSVDRQKAQMKVVANDRWVVGVGMGNDSMPT